MIKETHKSFVEFRLSIELHSKSQKYEQLFFKHIFWTCETARVTWMRAVRAEPVSVPGHSVTTLLLEHSNLLKICCAQCLKMFNKLTRHQLIRSSELPIHTKSINHNGISSKSRAWSTPQVLHPSKDNMIQNYTAPLLSPHKLATLVIARLTSSRFWPVHNIPCHDS